MKDLLLTHNRAVGDIVTMTAFVRDLYQQFHQEYRIHIASSFRDVWANNPFVASVRSVQAKPVLGAELVPMGYGDYIEKGKHFLYAWYQDFFRKKSIQVAPTYPKPEIFLSDAERVPPFSEPYWVVLPGGKTDFTTKWIYTPNLQKAINVLHGMGLKFIQVGEKSSSLFWNPYLHKVISMVGQTSVREYFRLIYHSQGVICGITSAMHIAAAFDKPCVVIAGGRESASWEGYVPGEHLANFRYSVRTPHRYLNVIGHLECCQRKGCWRTKTKFAKKSKEKPTICSKTVATDVGDWPKCHMMVTPETIVSGVLSYYLDKTLKGINMVPGLQSVVRVDEKTEAEVTVVLRPSVSPTLPLPISLPVIESPKPETLPTVVAPKLPPETVPVITPIASPPLPKEGFVPAFDSPQFGGKITLFVLCYGEFHNLHRKCLQAIVNTPHFDRIELRVAGNELCLSSVQMIEEMVEKKQVFKFYNNRDNRKKYPVMREIFRDPQAPITTPWVLWFDDDTICDIDSEWLLKLAETIRVCDSKVGMIGPPYVYNLSAGQVKWIRSAKWYKGVQLRDKSGRAVPNGKAVHFATGSLWAMRTECIEKCDIPDDRLGHNGGDWTIGEQIHQSGYTLVRWGSNKKIVNWSSVKRRGLSEKHPGQ